MFGHVFEKRKDEITYFADYHLKNLTLKVERLSRKTIYGTVGIVYDTIGFAQFAIIFGKYCLSLAWQLQLSRQTEKKKALAY